MGTTRSYACTTQTALTRLGSNVRHTSRVLLGINARRATLVSLLLWRRVLQRLPRLQRGPQKPVAIAGAQLCPWNARRKLYQQVGNFVGSVISPVLANMTLDGLEKLIHEHYAVRRKDGSRSKVNVVRYADDFVITGTSQRLLEEEVKPLVTKFLQERGLELSQEKTRITHIADGFDFLGKNIRKYNGQLL